MDKLILEDAYETTKESFKRSIISFAKRNPTSNLKEVLFEQWEQVDEFNVDSLYENCKKIMLNRRLESMNSDGNSMLKVFTIVLATGALMRVLRLYFFEVKEPEYGMNGELINAEMKDTISWSTVGVGMFGIVFGLAVKFDVRF